MSVIRDEYRQRWHEAAESRDRLQDENARLLEQATQDRATIMLREVERDEARNLNEQMRKAWEKDNLCGICPYRQAIQAENARLREALGEISQVQPGVLKAIRDNGFVFDSIGREPGNWQHLAFTIYSHLCEIDSIARTALLREEEQ